MNIKNLLLCISLFLIVSLQAASAEQIRLGIVPFSSGTREVPPYKAVAVSDSVSKALQASPSIAVMERERLKAIAIEQAINVSPNNHDALLKLGQVAGCKYMLLGSVTQLIKKDFQSESEIMMRLYKHNSEPLTGTMTVEARLIDIATGKVILSFSKSDDTHNKNFSGIADELRKFLADESPMIISVNKNNVRINRGSMSGVETGTLYKVYQDGEEFFDLDGKSLGKRIINLAILRVTNVNSEFSSAEILNKKQQSSKQSESKKSAKTTKSKSRRTEKSKKIVKTNNDNTPILIREGDKIEAISLAEAENLKLASQRLGE